MEQRVSSLAKNGKIKRRRLAEFLRVEEIGSHAKRVKGTLENIVFKGMEESEKEIRAKRMWFSLFALALLIALGVTLSRHVQSEVAIFHPSACLGGWNGVEKATGKPETAKGEAFSNINSAILPENTIADLFCGDFKGEIPADTEPKVLVLRIAWSTEGSTSTNVIEGESFASSTTEILDAKDSTSTDFILIEPIQINDATSSAEGGSTETSTTTATAEENAPQSSTEITDTASTTNEAQQSTNPVQEETEVQKSTEETLPVTEPSTPQETQVEQVPPEVPPEDTQSRGNLRGYLSFLKVFFERAHAQEAEQPSVLVVPIDTPPTEEVVQEPSVLESPIDDTPPPVSETIQATTTTEESDTTQPSVLVVPIDTPPTEEVVQEPSVLESPINDTPVSLEEIATTSSATTSDLSATSTTDIATGTEEIVSTQDTPLFDIMYSLDGTNWISLGSVALGELLATQFQIPVPEGSSWGDLSKLQLHIKRNQTVDFTPTIFLDAITLEVEVVRIPHVEPIHPDFERDAIVRDVIEEGVRIVTIINADTQEEETWYMYLEEEVSTTTESLIVATSTAEATTTTTFTMATSSNASSTETVSTSTVATGTESVRIPQMKEKNVWKKYIGSTSTPTFEELMAQETIPSLEEAASSTEMAEEEIILDLLPDLAADKIRRIKGVFLNSIIIQVIGKTKDELWLYDAENETKRRIEAGTSTSVSVEYPFGIKGGFIFWLSNEETIVYAYNPSTGVFLEKPIPPFDFSKGERAEIHFENIPWKVIVSVDGFTFYSRETGEVFSDEDGVVQEVLRRKFNLDTILNAERLNQLDFSVENAENEE